MAAVTARVQIENTERNPLLKNQRSSASSRHFPSTQEEQRKRKIANRYTKCFFIGQWPVLYIIGMTVIANFFVNFPTEATSDSHTNITHRITVISRTTYGVMLLLYPVMGWLAQAYITYYRSVGGGLYFILISMSIAFALSIAGIIQPSINDNIFYWIVAGIALIIYFLGNGIFTANAIQLGTDQMLEASSEQLSSFVHWYYWATQLGGPLIYLQIIILKLVPKESVITNNVYFLVMVLSLSQIILAIVGITMFHAARRHLYRQPTTRNTIKTIYSVLLYAKKHKYPERRSAMTYWEDSSPSRMDLGKEKYGGPFTAEEVENTKSFLRILLLLVSLFGIYTIDNTTALTENIVHDYTNHTNHTASTPIQVFILHNTNFISQLTVVLMIPFYQIIVKPLLNYYTPSMLKRFWFGLFCAFLSSLTAIIIKIIIDTGTHQNDLCAIKSSIEIKDFNMILALLIVPQVLYGFAELLVFLTGLEFILAQAPRKLQGLLIGLWYAMGIIKQANDSIDDNKNVSKKCVVYITRCCVTAASLIVYSIVVYFYKYRRRGDIVDRYGLAANKVARTIDRREQATRSHDSIQLHISVPSGRNSINSHTQGSEELTHLY